MNQRPFECRHSLLLLGALSLLLLASCGGEDGAQSIEERGLTLEELLLRDARTCVYNPDYPQELIDGLSLQLIEELRCINPNWLEFYESCEEVGCIFANSPQPLAARPEVLDALHAAALAEDDYISINAAYRDVAMQYFSRWYKENCNSSFPAAVPGNSNHQGGRAVDVHFYNFWWDALLEVGFEHPLVNDNPHFEFVGDAAFRNESEQLKSLGVLAFQRLWNRNFPDDAILEDGVYGANSKQRLGDSPVAGFPIGACTYDGGGDDATDGDTGDADGGQADTDAEVDGTPDVDGSDTMADADTVDGDMTDMSDAGGGEDVTDAQSDIGADVTADASTDSTDADSSEIGDVSDAADTESDAVTDSLDAGGDSQDASSDTADSSTDADSPSTEEPLELRDRLVYGGGSGNGNCSSSSGDPGLPIGGVLAFAGLMLIRRRQRTDTPC